MGLPWRPGKQTTGRILWLPQRRVQQFLQVFRFRMILARQRVAGVVEHCAIVSRMETNANRDSRTAAPIACRLSRCRIGCVSCNPRTARRRWREALPTRRCLPEFGSGICNFLECLLESDPKIPPISRIILYGSCARGDSHDESDVDIAVVFHPAKLPDDNERLSLLHAMGDARDECTSRILADVAPMAVWERELRRPAERPRPEFFQSIISEGIEITPEL